MESALLPTFRMPADVHMTWTENAASAHVASEYFLVRTDRSLNSGDPNGLAQIFQAQLEMRGWRVYGTDTENSVYISSWIITDSRCGAQQVTFNLVQAEHEQSYYYGTIQIVRL
jgi:hypothetical protein